MNLQPLGTGDKILQSLFLRCNTEQPAISVSPLQADLLNKNEHIVHIHIIILKIDKNMFYGINMNYLGGANNNFSNFILYIPKNEHLFSYF